MWSEIEEYLFVLVLIRKKIVIKKTFIPKVFKKNFEQVDIPQKKLLNINLEWTLFLASKYLKMIILWYLLSWTPDCEIYTREYEQRMYQITQLFGSLIRVYFVGYASTHVCSFYFSVWRSFIYSFSCDCCDIVDCDYFRFFLLNFISPLNRVCCNGT